jgi:flagellin
MALTVATNTGALMAQAAASSVNKEMEMSMERLSTGKRINGASDDAAGVAIASRLTSEIKGTNQAIRNAMDGQALIDTAEGAHAEVENILQRMRELAVQSANGTNDSSDRAALQGEIDSLSSEIDRIAQVTTWAGTKLLNGDETGDAAAGSSASSASFTFNVGSRTGAADTVSATIDAVSVAKLGLGANIASVSSSVGFDSTGSIASDGYAISISTGAEHADATGTDTAPTITFDDYASANNNYVDGETLTFTIDGHSVTFAFASDDAYADDDIGLGEQLQDAINAAGIQGVTASNNAGVVTISKTALDVSTTALSQSAIDLIDAAINTVNSQRASLGSISNRLDSTVSNLTNISSNLQAGRGRIEDADFAAETTSLAKSQILQQASTAMLAQANASKQNVLSLLQG